MHIWAPVPVSGLNVRAGYAECLCCQNISIRMILPPQPRDDATSIAVSSVDTSALELAKGDRFYLQVPRDMFSCTIGIVNQQNNPRPVRKHISVHFYHD